MTPVDLAQLHAQVFTVPRPFTQPEFTDLLAHPSCFLCATDHSFALGRVIADEAELLTLAVDPNHRRKGQGQAALAQFQQVAQQRHATEAFLEVDEINIAAIALYASNGFVEHGRRRHYYHHPDGRKTDALILRKPL